ncbi:hypothetical protein EJB05_56485, partial [Eragrostis curvula]
MKGLCSCAQALVLAAALVVSSCSDLADGVRTAPSKFICTSSLGYIMVHIEMTVTLIFSLQTLKKGRPLMTVFHRAGASSGSADARRLDVEPADRGTSNGYKPHQVTTPHESEPAEDDELVLASRQRAASGSRLPDCAHACGACSPCRRVMVSFRCAESASESCPIAYRCMCRGRFFHVPSL